MLPAQSSVNRNWTPDLSLGRLLTSPESDRDLRDLLCDTRDVTQASLHCQSQLLTLGATPARH